MGRKSKIAAVVLSISVLLGGCSLGKTDIVFTTGLSSNEVFKIEHEKVSLAEAKVYLCNYQNLYGNVYGIDLWEQQYRKDGSRPVSEEAADDVRVHDHREKTLCSI